MSMHGSGSRAQPGAVRPEWDGQGRRRSIDRRVDSAGGRVEDDALDLLLDFDQLIARLRALLPSADERPQLFDAFLVAAACQQTIADHLHRGGGVRSLGPLGVAVRTRLPHERRLAAWENQIADLVKELARAVMATGAAGAPRLVPRADFLSQADAFP